MKMNVFAFTLTISLHKQKPVENALRSAQLRVIENEILDRRADAGRMQG